jgi:hypothetical protein
MFRFVLSPRSRFVKSRTVRFIGVTGVAVLSLAGVASSATMPTGTGFAGPTATRPAIVSVSADRSYLLAGLTKARPRQDSPGRVFGRLRWTTWNKKEGVASGAEWINNCEPSCGGGVYRAYKATVRVFDLASLYGKPIFLRMDVSVGGKTVRFSAISIGKGWGWDVIES